MFFHTAHRLLGREWGQYHLCCSLISLAVNTWRGLLAKEASLLVLQSGFLLFSSSAESWLDSSPLPSQTEQDLACEKTNSGRQAASLGRGTPTAIALGMVHGIWHVQGDW